MNRFLRHLVSLAFALSAAMAHANGSDAPKQPPTLNNGIYSDYKDFKCMQFVTVQKIEEQLTTIHMAGNCGGDTLYFCFGSICMSQTNETHSSYLGIVDENSFWTSDDVHGTVFYRRL